MDTTSKTHVLFFDLHEISEMHDVRHSVVQAQKHTLNPLIPLGDWDEWDAVNAAPWESRTVIYDQEEDLFKAWYAGIDVKLHKEYMTGYATSNDGVRWSKPNLGLYDYRGSKDNNICHPAWGSFVKDSVEEDPAKRYKMMVKGPDRDEQGTFRDIRMNYSPDGVHWQDGPKVDMPQWEGRAPDIVAFLRDDQDSDPAKRFKLVWQTKSEANKPGPRRVRVKHLAWSPDGLMWTANPTNPFLHPNDSTEQENHFLAIIPYKGWYIMLYEYGWYMPRRTHKQASMFNGSSFVINADNHWCFNYCSDVRLAASRDGIHYERINSNQVVIPRGPCDAWDSGHLVISDKAAIKDDTIYLYYCGNGQESGRFRRRDANRVTRMGLATLKLDRFTCLHTSDGHSYGEVLTAPITVRDSESARLVLNLSDTNPDRSWIEVDVLDGTTGAPVTGYACDDCALIDEDGLSVPAQWETAPTLANVTCNRIRLRFRLFGAVKLYGFRFEEIPSTSPE